MQNIDTIVILYLLCKKYTHTHTKKQKPTYTHIKTHLFAVMSWVVQHVCGHVRCVRQGFACSPPWPYLRHLDCFAASVSNPHPHLPILCPLRSVF